MKQLNDVSLKVVHTIKTAKGKWEIYVTKKGRWKHYGTRLVSRNGYVICANTGFNNMTAAKKNIAAVRKTAN